MSQAAGRAFTRDDMMVVDAEEAVALRTPTDFSRHKSDPVVLLADVLDHAGSSARAAAVRAEAEELYRQKGNRARLEAVRRPIDRLTR